MSEHEDSIERPNKRPRISPGPSSSAFDHVARGSTAGKKSVNGSVTSVLDPKEIDVGIRDFVSRSTFQFKALLKKRYTDFLVNEVLPDGEVVHLVTTTLPKTLHTSDPDSKKRSRPNDHRNAHGNGAADDTNTDVITNATKKEEQTDSLTIRPGEISEEDRSQLVAFLNETAVAEVLDLYKAVLANPTRHPKDHAVVRTEFTSDRSIRADIHAAIRRIFSAKIESSTDHKGLLCLTAAHTRSRKPPRSEGNGQPNNYPGKLDWLERGGQYLHFTLCKENKDTMEAISFLVRQLKVSPKVFQFAGTKDRRAVTSQRVSAYRLDAERVAKQNHHLRNAAVGDFEYKPAGLELGDLGGNEFILTLRECECPELSELGTDETLVKIQAVLHEALRSLHTNGFLNYFGLQRFGTFSTRTDTVGLNLLSNNFRGACDAILHYETSVLAASDTDHSPDGHASTADTASNAHSGPSRDEIQRAQAIELFRKTANAHKPLEILPKKFSAENQIIRHLARSPTDYIGALLAIPRNLRLMYVHAYQSLVWNHAATNRWRLFGSTIVEGDLVLVNEHKDKENASGSMSTAADATATAADGTSIDADGEIILAPSAHDRSNTVDDVFERARALTASEAASGQYTIFDLVLPLPGYDILYPANESGRFYADFMAGAAGGGLDPHDMRRKQKDFSLSGGYRKLLARTGATFAVHAHPYRRDEQQFVTTDLDRIKEAAAAAAADGTEPTNPTLPKSTGPIPGSEDEGEGEGEGQDKIAVVLKFQLGASQYATMALRELSRGGIVTYKPDFGSGK